MSESDESIHDDAEPEVVDGEPVPEGLPVLAEVHELAPALHNSVSVVQAAAMTAGGFFAGAVAMAVVKGLAARRLAQEAERLPAPIRNWSVPSSRTYLVNVRVVQRPSRPVAPPSE